MKDDDLPGIHPDSLPPITSAQEPENVLSQSEVMVSNQVPTPPIAANTSTPNVITEPINIEGDGSRFAFFKKRIFITVVIFFSWPLGLSEHSSFILIKKQQTIL